MIFTKKYFLIGVTIVIILFLSIYMLLAHYVAKNTTVDNKKPSDVILVLGARAYIDGKYNPCLVARLSHAVDLYKEHYASKLLFSGGYDVEDHRNEAQTMQKIAEQEGVPEQNMLLEPNSRSTYENFVFSRRILNKNHLNSMIIVTEPFHEPRAALVAKKLGLSYTVSPAVASPCWVGNTYLSQYFLKEPLAIIAYKIENKL